MWGVVSVIFSFLGKLVKNSWVMIIPQLAISLVLFRFIIKLAVVGVVMYFSVQFTDFLQSILSQYMPTELPIMAFACQLGLFDGINLFFKIVFTAFSYKLIIRAVISA